MALLRPRVEEFHRLRHGLGQVAGAKPPPASPEPKSAEEVSRILGAFRAKYDAAMAETRAANGTMDRPMDRPEMRPKAVPVNQLALLKGYREAAERATDPGRPALLKDRADRLAGGLGLSIGDGIPVHHQEAR